MTSFLDRRLAEEARDFTGDCFDPTEIPLDFGEPTLDFADITLECADATLDFFFGLASLTSLVGVIVFPLLIIAFTAKTDAFSPNSGKCTFSTKLFESLESFLFWKYET